MLKKTLIAAALLASLAGCATPAVEMVDTRNDQGESVVGLDYRDFEKAASDAIQSMLASGSVNNPKGGRYVLTISRIKNDTMQRIDTDQLVKKIRVELLNSGKVAVTTALSVNGPEDSATADMRELRGNAMVKQSTVKGDGKVIAPDLSLSGKILQRNVPMSGGRTQIEYYFQLTLTDIESGLGLWENELPIIKRSNQNTATW